MKTPENQGLKKCHFQTLRTLIFEIIVASKPFSKIFSMRNFKFKLCFSFPENYFNFVTQECAKNN